MEWIKETEQSGGKAEGNILHPTVLLEAKADLRASCQEVLAPIILINKVKSVEEAIEKVNDSRYGHLYE